MEIDLDNLVFNGLEEAQERNAERLEEADKKWSPHYPAVIQRWYDHWDIITPIFKFSMGVRTAFYTTNIIESLNASYRTNSMGVGLDFASEIFNRIGC